MGRTLFIIMAIIITLAVVNWIQYYWEKYIDRYRHIITRHFVYTECRIRAIVPSNEDSTIRNVLIELPDGGRKEAKSSISVETGKRMVDGTWHKIPILETEEYVGRSAERSKWMMRAPKRKLVCEFVFPDELIEHAKYTEIK